jgi:putative protease
MSDIELLAPGGDSDSIKAAILAGANAVFCGVGSFNARKRASNITIKELGSLVLLAHSNDCKIFVTFNTVMLDTERENILAEISEVQKVGADAVIIQDIGLLFLIKKYIPSLECHASTQMTTHNSGQVEFLKSFGVTQLNLSRELSINEIKTLASVAKKNGIKTEVFVHGAFCVSFSGECYFSQTSCGHSGNRGACVQSCRRYYTLDATGKGEKLLPFNLKDNSAFSVAKELIDSGADSLKIEGRIKDFYFVYTTVKSWREKIDAVINNEKNQPSSSALNSVFNRDFTSGYLTGELSKEMFNSDSGKDVSLVDAGVVVVYFADHKTLKIDSLNKLIPGEMIKIFDGEEFICEGEIGREVIKNEYLFTIKNRLMGRISRGQKVKIIPGALKKALLLQEIGKMESLKTPLTVTATAKVGFPLSFTFCANDKKITVTSDMPIEAAQKQGAQLDKIKEKVAKLGDTPFALTEFMADEFDENCFIPVSQINQLRRDAVAQLLDFEELSKISRLEFAEQSISTPQIALLVDSEKLVKQFENSDKLVVFEIPPNCASTKEKLISLFKNNSSLIPSFPAILIGADFSAAIKILKSKKFAQIITDNSGVAHEASKLNLNWVAGSLLNCTNSDALIVFKERGAVGSFLSIELGDKQRNEIVPPPQFQLWHTLLGKQLLMNSRQCFIRNCNLCSKDISDENCIPCSKKTTVYNSAKEPFRVVKRPGFYNQIFSGKDLLDLSVLKSKKFSRFVLDFREIETSTKFEVPVEKIVALAESMVEGKSGSEEGLTKAVIRVDGQRDRSELK